MKRVAEVPGVSRSNLALRKKGQGTSRGGYRKSEDDLLLPAIRRFVDARPTYGYRRIAALVNRERRSEGLAPINRKRIHRIMHANALVLERHTGRHRKAKKENIVLSRWLHCDVDVVNDGTLDRLRAFVPAPTFIMASGGGFQVGWKLDEPTTDLDAVEQANKALATALGGDDCHNIDRIMRVPGTINLPNAKKRAAGRVPVTARMIDQNWERAYALDAFPKAELDPNPVKPLAVATPVTKASHIEPVGLEALPIAVLEATRAIIRLGDDPERPRGGEAPRFKSRSEGVFSTAVALGKPPAISSRSSIARPAAPFAANGRRPPCRRAIPVEAAATWTGTAVTS